MMKYEKRGPCRACFAKDQEPQGYARKIALNITDLTGVVKGFGRPILHLFRVLDNISLTLPRLRLPSPLSDLRRIHGTRVHASSMRIPRRWMCSFRILQTMV